MGKPIIVSNSKISFLVMLLSLVITIASAFGITSIVGMPSRIEVLTTRIVTFAAKEYVTISGKSIRPTLVELGKWKDVITFIVSLYGFTAVILPLASIVIISLITAVTGTLIALAMIIAFVENLD